MSAPAVGVDRPTLRIGGTSYPVLLPTIRDPRLHLAGVIVTLQVLGQTAFDFNLSLFLAAVGYDKKRKRLKLEGKRTAKGERTAK